MIRPDHYIAARGRTFDANTILNAIAVSLGKGSPSRTNQSYDPFNKYRNDHKYKKLIEAHKGLSKTESELLNSKLILMLMDKVSEKDLMETLATIKK